MESIEFVILIILIIETKMDSSIIGCLKSTYVTKGVRGFYSGFAPCFIRTVPAMAITLGINERMRKLLEF